MIVSQSQIPKRWSAVPLISKQGGHIKVNRMIVSVQRTQFSVVLAKFKFCSNITTVSVLKVATLHMVRSLLAVT